MDDKILEEAGLTKNEITVYKTLLEFGPSTAGPLTQKSGVHRSRVYESLNRLVDKGLVSYKIKANRKYFQAQNPEELIDFIEEKKEKLKSIIPELSALQLIRPETHEANVFEGYKGLKSVFYSNLKGAKRGDCIYVVGARSGQDISPETWTSFFKGFHKKRLAIGVRYKIIFNEDLRKSEIAKSMQKMKITDVGFIKQYTPASFNVFRNKVAIILWKKKPYAFVITSREVADSFRQYFNTLWKQAKN